MGRLKQRRHYPHQRTSSRTKAACSAEHRRIGIEHLEIIQMRLLQRRKNRTVVLIRSAASEKFHSGTNPAIKVRDHTAEVMGDYFHVGYRSKSPEKTRRDIATEVS